MAEVWNAALVLVSASILILAYGKTHNLKRGTPLHLINAMLFLWTFLYGVVAPTLVTIFGIRLTLLHEDLYGVASLILCLNYVTFLICSRVFPRTDVFKTEHLRSVGVCTLVPSASLFFLIENGSARGILFTAMIIPALCALYIAGKDIRSILIAVFAHLCFLALALSSEFIIDSKERIVVSLIFPPLVYTIVHVGLRPSPRWVALILGAAATFLVASLAVRDFRQGEVAGINLDLDTVQIWPVYERLAVIDALAGVVRNELDEIPKRPSMPSWTLSGVVLQLFPAFFERPNHAREALPLVGYMTSSDDVNIALTVPGHLLWSFGAWIALPLLATFWIIFHGLLHASTIMRPSLRNIFLISLATGVTRLEGLSNSYFGNTLMVFLLFTLVSVITSAIPRQQSHSRPQ